MLENAGVNQDAAFCVWRPTPEGRLVKRRGVLLHVWELCFCTVGPRGTPLVPASHAARDEAHDASMRTARTHAIRRVIMHARRYTAASRSHCICIGVIVPPTYTPLVLYQLSLASPVLLSRATRTLRRRAHPRDTHTPPSECKGKGKSHSAALHSRPSCPRARRPLPPGAPGPAPGPSSSVRKPARGARHTPRHALHPL